MRSSPKARRCLLLLVWEAGQVTVNFGGVGENVRVVPAADMRPVMVMPAQASAQQCGNNATYPRLASVPTVIGRRTPRSCADYHWYSTQERR